MPRRYADVEATPVADIRAGDEVVSRKRAQLITRTDTAGSSTVVITWDDGSTQTFDLAVEPTLEVVVTKKADEA